MQSFILCYSRFPTALAAQGSISRTNLHFCVHSTHRRVVKWSVRLHRNSQAKREADPRCPEEQKAFSLLYRRNKQVRFAASPFETGSELPQCVPDLKFSDVCDTALSPVFVRCESEEKLGWIDECVKHEGTNVPV